MGVPSPVVLADAWTHPPRCPRVEPAPVKTDAWTHPHPLSSRMHGPIPLVVLADAWTHPPPLSSRMRGPIPYSLPTDMSFRARRSGVEESCCLRAYSPCPHTSTRASLTPLPLLSSWLAHDGVGDAWAGHCPSHPGCWTTDRRRTPGPRRAARPPSVKVRRTGCSERP